MTAQIDHNGKTVPVMLELPPPGSNADLLIQEIVLAHQNVIVTYFSNGWRGFIASNPIAKKDDYVCFHLADDRLTQKFVFRYIIGKFEPFNIASMNHGRAD